MRTWFPIALTAVALSTGAGAAPATTPPEKDSRMVLAGKDAVLAGPPDPICGAMADRAEWSPDSRYVLALRLQVELKGLGAAPGAPPMERSLVLWNSDTHRATEVWKARTTPQGGSQELGWTGAPGVALALTNVAGTTAPGAPPNPNGQRWVVRVDARRGVARPLVEVGDDTRLVTCPAQPTGALVSIVQRAVRFIRADGTLRPAIVLPDGVTPALSAWSRDGSRLLVSGVGAGSKPGEPGLSTYLSLDPASGKVEQLKAPQEAYETAAPSHVLRLESLGAELTGGGTQHSIRPLWLTGSDPGSRTLLAADAEWGSLSPDGTAVMYSTEQSVWVRPLIRMPAQLILARREEAIRAVHLSNARQIGLALFTYAQDHDDLLPGAAEVLTTLLGDKLSETILDGFIYTFAGGKTGDIAAPAETLLGYTPMRGGRINLYADGHAVWEPDKRQ